MSGVFGLVFVRLIHPTFWIAHVQIDGTQGTHFIRPTSGQPLEPYHCLNGFRQIRDGYKQHVFRHRKYLFGFGSAGLAFHQGSHLTKVTIFFSRNEFLFRCPLEHPSNPFDLSIHVLARPTFFHQDGSTGLECQRFEFFGRCRTVQFLGDSKSVTEAILTPTFGLLTGSEIVFRKFPETDNQLIDGDVWERVPVGCFGPRLPLSDNASVQFMAFR